MSVMCVVCPRYLVERGDVDVGVCDAQGSSVLHYASASDCQELVLWILNSCPQLREKLNSENEVRSVVYCKGVRERERGREGGGGRGRERQRGRGRLRGRGRD